MRQEQLFYLGVKALIRNKSGDVLLLKVKRATGETYFDLPGGRINKNETLPEALSREIQEETGITDFTVGRLLGTALTEITIPISSDEKGGLLLSVYACSAADISDLVAEEGVQLEWHPQAEVTKRLDNYPNTLKAVIDEELRALYEVF